MTSITVHTSSPAKRQEGGGEDSLLIKEKKKKKKKKAREDLIQSWKNTEILSSPVNSFALKTTMLF